MKLSQPPTPLSDHELATEALGFLSSGGKTELLVVTRQGASAVWLRAQGSQAEWRPAGCGDFGQACVDAVTSRRGVKVFLADVSTSPRETDPGPASAAARPVAKAELQAWLLDSLVACGLAVPRRGRGRTGAIAPATKEEVFHRAAWRCQMDGCADDLRAHLGATVSGNFSYLAHIVAASPDGPRGDPDLSAKLVNEASNILLLCDKCHRLIDRVDAEKYTTPYLQAMRERSVAAVRRMLDMLAYPKARAISLIGSIAGQAHPPLTRTEMDEALWSQGLRADERSPHALASMPRQLGNPHDAAFWTVMMRSLSQGVVELRGLLEGTSSDEQAPKRLALFPLAATSALVLAGRVVGDKANITVFQPDRNAPKNRWLWPARAEALQANEFRLTNAGTGEPGGEAALRVSLTFDIADDRVPGDGMPTVHIKAGRLGPDAIAQPGDLVAFGQCVDDALKLLQDQWKVAVVHLFVGAPASACLRLGQKLQARHHATVICYETAQESKCFEESIRITRQQARHGPTGESIDLNP